MTSQVPKIAVAGLALTAAFAIVMASNLSGNQAASVTGDFRNAATAEVRDAQGKVWLRGTFAAVTGNPDDVERGATLTATPDGGQASGEAEIEYSKDKPNVQEIEFEVTGVPPRGIMTLVLDGRDVISATADDKGKAKAEFDVAVSQQ